jgi:UDP-N-acetylglucosamine:LPS N-acetylglucosamine transferase
MDNRKLNIAMAGWWTGWHVFPIKSLIDFIYQNPEYRSKIKKIYRFGKKTSLEKDAFQTLKSQYNKHWIQLIFVPIFSGKYRRETRWDYRLKNIFDAFLFLIWIFQSLFYLLYYKINVIFCKWWYVALPIVLAWILFRKKIIVHESDTHPWLVNKIASRFANKIFTWFDGSIPNWQTVWQILSADILHWLSHINSHSSQETKTRILITWWSQGSNKLYKNILNIIKKNSEFQSKFIFDIVLGLLNSDMSTDFDTLPNVNVYKFLSQKEMGNLLQNCDIWITRWWTTLLAEQKLFNLKLIIIPIPWTHDQNDNAKFYVQHYGDISLNQRDENFNSELTKILFAHIWYKKNPISDLEIFRSETLNKISKTKRAIISSILEY